MKSNRNRNVQVVDLINAQELNITKIIFCMFTGEMFAFPCFPLSFSLSNLSISPPEHARAVNAKTFNALNE